MDKHKHPFYGKQIYPDKEKKIIDHLLAPFRNESPSFELKKKMYDTLSQAKEEGKISIPFKIIYRKDPSKIQPDYIEVVLESKI